MRTCKKIEYSKDTIFSLIFDWMMKRYDNNGIYDSEVNIFINNEYYWMDESDMISEILID